MRADLEYITGVLDELEALVQQASSVPMNRGRGMVDRSDMLVLVEELRDSLPAELEEAKAAHREYDSVVSSGREEAERILQNARERAQEMAADSEPYRRAQRMAEENLDKAERYSEEISRGAEDYREQVMAKIERWFGESLESVVESRAELEGSPGGRDQTDETQPQERQEPFTSGDEDDEDEEQSWRASSA